MPKAGCGKRIFRNELDAKIALATMRSRDKEAQRIYPCPLCPGKVYHITKQAQRTPRRTRKRAPRGIDGESSRAIEFPHAG